jgi:hypothetical protein
MKLPGFVSGPSVTGNEGRGKLLRKKSERLLLLAALFLAGFGGPGAQEGGTSGGVYNRGDYLTIKLGVFGPGDELYFWWGHIGLIVEDAAAGVSRLYDWGVFSFDNEDFFTNFAFGRLLYRCDTVPAEREFQRYAAANRGIRVYTLDLPPETRDYIRRFAETSLLPENRNYYYHHFKDNCATRIRDILDNALGNQFRDRYGEAPGRFTLRQHVRRHTWSHPFFDWILNFWMGQNIDAPLRVWDEMFLPSEIARNIEDFSYRDAEGRERKLVSRVETLYRARNRPPVLETPRRQWPGELCLGLLAAAVLGLCMVLEKKKVPAGRVILGLSQSFLSLFFGVVGFLLFFMMAFTNHDYTYNNANILYVNPLLFAGLPLGIIYGFAKKEGRRFLAGFLLRILWVYVSLGCLLSMAIKLFPPFYQQNQVTQALVLPIALVLGFLPRFLKKP